MYKPKDETKSQSAQGSFNESSEKEPANQEPAVDFNSLTARGREFHAKLVELKQVRPKQIVIGGTFIFSILILTQLAPAASMLLGLKDDLPIGLVMLGIAAIGLVMVLISINKSK